MSVVIILIIASLAVALLGGGVLVRAVDRRVARHG